MVKDHVSVPVAILIGLAIGAAAGLLNGVMTAYVNISAFIATLSTGIIFGGIAFIVNQGATVFTIPQSFVRIGQGRFGPVPVAVTVTVVLCIIMYFVMARTTLGRWWYATGGNYDASYLAGLRVRRLRLLAYIASAMGGALGGILLVSRLASAAPNQGDAFTLTSITAVFLGMTAFKEGQPNIAGTVVGVLFLGVLTNGLNLVNVSTYDQLVITGTVTLLAVALSGAAKKRRM